MPQYVNNVTGALSTKGADGAIERCDIKFPANYDNIQYMPVGAVHAVQRGGGRYGVHHVLMQAQWALTVQAEGREALHCAPRRPA